MFEKFIIKAVIGAAGVTAVTMCCYLINMMIGDVKRDKHFDRMIDEIEKRHQERSEILNQMIKEAVE